MEMTLYTGGRRSEGGSRNITKQGRKVIIDKRIVNGGWSILTPHLSALNYFLALEY
ncbi:MAG: hypothetical protein MJB12_14175 [Firmicutes bacterium]|nr:hypothetical protein [Bacillota bacterium]